MVTHLLFAFTRRPLDPHTNLYDYRARWYDPSVGRFLTEDPAGLAADPNLYRYCGNSPLVNVDPSGRCYTGVMSAINSVTSAFQGAVGTATSIAGSLAGTASQWTTQTFSTAPASAWTSTPLRCWRSPRQHAVRDDFAHRRDTLRSAERGGSRTSVCCESFQLRATSLGRDVQRTVDAVQRQLWGTDNRRNAGNDAVQPATRVRGNERRYQRRYQLAFGAAGLRLRRQSA